MKRAVREILKLFLASINTSFVLCIGIWVSTNRPLEDVLWLNGSIIGGHFWRWVLMSPVVTCRQILLYFFY